MAQDSAAPLYLLLLKPWQALVGGDSGLRVLSVLIGTASIWLTFLIGRALLGTACGVAASFFMAVAPFHVLRSQIAKNTVLCLLATQAALLALLAAARGRSRWPRWVLFGLALAALLFSQGLAPLFLVALAPAFFFLADRPLKPRLAGWIGAHALAAVLFLPWAGVAWRQAAHVLSNFWAPRPGLLAPLRTLSEFLLLREARPPLSLEKIPPVGAALAAFPGLRGIADRIGGEIWVIPALLAMLAGVWLLATEGKGRVLLALASLFVLPVGGVWIASHLAASVYLDRALIPSMIPLPILLAVPLVVLAGRKAERAGSPGGAPGRRALRRGAGSLATVACVIALGVAWSHTETRTAAQWREAIAWLEEKAADGDAIAFDAHFGRVLFDRYVGERGGRFDLYGLPSDLYADEVPTMRKGVASQADLAPLEEAASSHSTIWLVLSHTELHDPEGLAYKWCDARMTKTDRVSFIGVVLLRYTSA